MAQVVRALRFARNTAVRGVGLVFLVVGLLVVNAAIVPGDAEAWFLLVLGLVAAAFGGYALLRPERFETRSPPREEDDDDFHTQFGNR